MASLLSRHSRPWGASLCNACKTARLTRPSRMRYATQVETVKAQSTTLEGTPFANVEPLPQAKRRARRQSVPRLSEDAILDSIGAKAKATPKRARRVASKRVASSKKGKRVIPNEAGSKQKDEAATEKDEKQFTQELAHHAMPANAVEDVEAPEKVPVPNLAHGLDRVLFNPGVYYLQDPRSRVYNFDPYLQQITPVEDFNFDALSEYITSSRDSTLDELARQHGLSIVGSTSSMTSTLAQFHFLLSANRPVNLARLSTAFIGKSTEFTPSQRAPTSIYLRHNDGIYAIDADKSLDSGETVLSFLGRSMEKMLTLDPEDFSKLRKDSQGVELPAPSREAYHYSKIGQMLMRSQLDCHDPRLPGTGTFDLKTRAVLPVRLDVRNHATGAGYQITQSTGVLESFEREYYDMIRAAFLKYSLQVRIGKMDGIFVAFHNTERIFGFQYISIDEMDDCLHGSSTANIAGREFIMSLKQLDKVLKMAIDKYAGRSMCLSFQTTGGKKPRMDIVVEALSDAEIQRRQQGELYAALKAAQKDEHIEKMPSGKKKNQTKKTLESMSSTLEQIMNKEETSESEESLGPQAKPSNPDRMLLRIEGRSYINDKPVTGPPTPSADDTWNYRFDITTVHGQDEIDKRLEDISKKRVAAFTDLGPAKGFDKYLSELQKVSEAGRMKLNQRLEETSQQSPVLYKMRESTRSLQQQYDKSFR